MYLASIHVARLPAAKKGYWGILDCSVLREELRGRSSNHARCHVLTRRKVSVAVGAVHGDVENLYLASIHVAREPAAK